MKKRRKFADGGVTGVQQPTYPFYGNQPQAGGASGGVNQTFNMQPQASAGMPEQQYAKGGQAKVGKVMREFKSGKLKSSSGQKVTNPKQAIAIGLSEAGLSKKAKGGEMKESKAMVKKEVSFMKKKGAPKSMVKHEMAEAGMKYGGKVKKMALGGMGAPASGSRMGMGMQAQRQAASSLPPQATRKTPGAADNANAANAYKTFTAQKSGNMGTGSQAAVRPGLGAGVSARGISSGDLKMAGLMKKGGAVKKMASGGLAAGHKSADGVAKKGKTKAMQPKMAGATGMKHGGKTKMRKGGYC